MSNLVVVNDDNVITMSISNPPKINAIVSKGPGPQGSPGPDGEDGTAAVLAHIADETPHSVYDEGPSFTLLYENAKV